MVISGSMVLATAVTGKWNSSYHPLTPMAHCSSLPTDGTYDASRRVHQVFRVRRCTGPFQIGRRCNQLHEKVLNMRAVRRESDAFPRTHHYSNPSSITLTSLSVKSRSNVICG